MDGKSDSIKIAFPSILGIEYRARQNVVLELGYFLGKLGRNRVFSLKKGKIEIPSDYHGIVYTDYKDEWKITLENEMKAAGIHFDHSRI